MDLKPRMNTDEHGFYMQSALNGSSLHTVSLPHALANLGFDAVKPAAVPPVFSDLAPPEDDQLIVNSPASIAPSPTSPSLGDQGELETLVDDILTICGLGRLLVAGAGTRPVVDALLSRGVDCHGLEIHAACSRAADVNQRHGSGSFFPLPFDKASFDAAVVVGCLEKFDEIDLTRALHELCRVVGHSLFALIPTLAPPACSSPLEPVRDRGWWESQFFAAGFRKHPLSHSVVPYESLEQDQAERVLCFERIVDAALKSSSKALAPTDIILLDLSRRSGRVVEAAQARYQLAATFVRPGDTVLDLGCKSGFGTYLLHRATRGARFIGVDSSPGAIDYARAHFAAQSPLLEYGCDAPLAAIRSMPDYSIQFIACLDLLDETPDREELLKECRRVLIPGGRLLLSAANGWRDRHVGPTTDPPALTWPTLHQFLGKHFLVESAFQQIARGCKSGGADGQWKPLPRRLRAIPLAEAANTETEWWVVVAMKQPLAAPAPFYKETVFQHTALSGHLSLQYGAFYRNPWILHSLIHAGYRTASPEILISSALKILRENPADSVDSGAALCLLLYRAIDGTTPADLNTELLREQAGAYLAIASPNPHQLRWQISIAYALGRLHMDSGQFAAARQCFDSCATRDPLAFSVHLATKTTEALFWSGWLALTTGDVAEAESVWKKCLRFGERLLAQPLSETLMYSKWPNLFDYGDGMRELIYALENVAKCANGVHALRLREQGRSFRWDLIQNSFRFQHETSHRDLHVAQTRVARLCAEIDQTRNELREHDSELTRTRHELRERASELDRTRHELLQRTSELDRTRNELRGRTSELDQTRSELVERTSELDWTREELRERTRELDQTRNELRELTSQLEIEQ